MYAQAKKPYAHSPENSRVLDKNQHFTWNLFLRFLGDQLLKWFTFFECLKLISQYSDYGFLKKGNNSKT